MKNVNAGAAVAVRRPGTSYAANSRRAVTSDIRKP